MKWKPQVLTSIVALAIIGVLAMLFEYPEVAAACPAGIVALGMKLLGKDE